ncbi:MAG: hypothetical protein ACKO15_15450, partial [Burkholderiales bacterium]
MKFIEASIDVLMGVWEKVVVDTSSKKSRLLMHNGFFGALLLLACQTGFAQTDIATTPVASGVTVNAKPNIMLLMKNSG